MNLKQKFRQITMRRGLTFIVCNGGSEHDGAGIGILPFFYHNFRVFSKDDTDAKSKLRLDPHCGQLTRLPFIWPLIEKSCLDFGIFPESFSVKKGKKNLLCRRRRSSRATILVPCCTEFWPL